MERNYDLIWAAFLNVEPEFKHLMQYGKEEIEAMEDGIKKFIDYMDWSKEEQVISFRTDMLQVIPCPHCRNEFGIYSYTLGLCKKCEKSFDFNKVFEHARIYIDLKAEQEAKLLMYNFVKNPAVRELYRKYTKEEVRENFIKDNFTGSRTFKYIIGLAYPVYSNKGIFEDFVKVYEDNILSLLNVCTEDHTCIDGCAECSTKAEQILNNMIELIKEKGGNDWFNLIYIQLIDMVRGEYSEEMIEDMIAEIENTDIIDDTNQSIEDDNSQTNNQ